MDAKPDRESIMAIIVDIMIIFGFGFLCGFAVRAYVSRRRRLAAERQFEGIASFQSPAGR